MLLEAEFWVAVAFVIFMGIAWKAGAFSAMTNGLDGRAKRVRHELDEAKRLRAEAAAVLASYEAKRAAAEAEAQAIVTQARAEAEELARESAERMAEFVTRRQKQAEGKIAAAEAQATADVRAAAADAAVKAAEIVLTAEAKGPAGEQLVARGIADLKALTHH